MTRGKLVFLASLALLGMAVVFAGAGPAAAQATVSSGAVAGVDNIAPAPVTSLATEVDLAGPSVALTWELSADDYSRPVPVGQDFTSGGTFVNTNDVAKYTIERADLGGTFAPVGSVASGMISYTDTTVVSGTTYLYQVMAVDGAGNESEAAESESISLGPPPAFAISPALTDTINVGQAGKDSTATVTYIIQNTATDATSMMTVTAAVTGTGFAVSPASKTIGAGKADTLKVTFAAAQVANRNGTYTGGLTIQSNDPNNRQKTARLKATVAGALAAPTLDLSGLSISFATVQVGQTATRSLKITNKGGFALQTKVTLTGDAAFSISKDSTTVSVAPSDSLVVIASFMPDTAKTYTATIAIASNDPNRPTASVALSGGGSVGAAGPKVGVDAAGKQIIGFLNEDNKVDLSDFFLFADFFGTSSTSANWNPAADFSGDGLVNLTDFFLFADDFGKTAVSFQ